LKRIASTDNPGFKALRALAHSGRERRRQGRTVLDGLHLLQAWLAHAGAPAAVAVSEHGLAQAEIAGFLAAQPRLAVSVYADALFAQVSPVDTPTGILAVVDIPAPRLPDRIETSCIVLDAVQDAGNVGSMLRSAAAAGVGLALLTEGCAQAWSPRVLRAGMGAHFALTIVEHARPGELLAGYPGRIVATQADAPRSLYEADLGGPLAWLFGAEGRGLAPELAALAGQRVRIPMAAGSESLNVAAAAAVCLFEQLRRNGGPLTPRRGRCSSPP
jgi:TrmH family RNA methyltransferase